MSTDSAPQSRGFLADNVRTVAGVLAVVSVALVVAAAGGAVPARLVPRSEPLVALAPHLNALVIAGATVTLSLGVRAIRRGNVERHRRLMLSTFGLFVAFLALYLYKVVLEGPADFPGPATVYRFLYLPVLAVHILLAIASLGPVYYALGLALTRPVEAIYDSPHRRVGRVAATLWLVSFLLGLVVYVLLYVVPW